MDRKEELKKITNNSALDPLIDEFLFIENQLQELKKQPFIKIHPKDPTVQKTTPAAKLYKELLQQYTNISKILLKVNGSDDSEDESPLRRWLNAMEFR